MHTGLFASTLDATLYSGLLSQPGRSWFRALYRPLKPQVPVACVCMGKDMQPATQDAPPKFSARQVRRIVATLRPTQFTRAVTLRHRFYILAVKASMKTVAAAGAASLTMTVKPAASCINTDQKIFLLSPEPTEPTAEHPRRGAITFLRSCWPGQRSQGVWSPAIGSGKQGEGICALTVVGLRWP
jgi:hypothetical protein